METHKLYICNKIIKQVNCPGSVILFSYCVGDHCFGKKKAHTKVIQSTKCLTLKDIDQY